MKINYRSLAAALPLPMLSLAASYGVYTFGLLYLPLWVSFIMAASFEAVYIGLAAMELKPADRKRASAISKGAVTVSIVYNVIAGVLHRRPEWLTDLNLWYEWVLAVIHGAPLALLCYLVADLVIHRQSHAHETSNEPLELLRDELRRETISLGSFEPTPTVSARLSHVPKPEVHETYETYETYETNSAPQRHETNETLTKLLELPEETQEETSETSAPERDNSADFVEQLALGANYSTSQLIALIGKSRAQSNRIISAAVESGRIEQVQRGLYRRVQE